MKKSIFLVILAFVSYASAHSQGFDYQDTPFEIGVDVLPVFGGNNPYSLFFRKNFQTSAGKSRAWRATVSTTNSHNFSDPTNNNNIERSDFNNIGFSIGKEFQKTVTEKIIVYSGLDLGFHYSGRTYSFDAPAVDLVIIGRKNNTSIYSATLFSGVKYHLSPRFSVFAELGIEGAYSRSINVVSWGTSNFESRRDRNLTDEQIRYNIIPLRSVRIAYHF